MIRGRNCDKKDTFVKCMGELSHVRPSCMGNEPENSVNLSS